MDEAAPSAPAQPHTIGSKQAGDITDLVSVKQVAGKASWMTNPPTMNIGVVK